MIPEATPNPRTIRFGTGPIQTGPSRWYESAPSAADDPHVARLFAEFEADVDNVLVGNDFVAVGVRRPDRWEQMLVPILRAVSTEFVPSAAPAPDALPPAATAVADASATPRARDVGGASGRTRSHVARARRAAS